MIKNELVLAYQQAGEHGDPVVLLHGLFGSAKNLGGMARILAQNFCVYSMDLLNHGRSPHSGAMNIPLLADAVLQTLDALELSTIALFGHSLGGKVAMYLALYHPQRITRLAIGDIAPVAYPPHHTELLQAMLALDVASLTSRSEADKQLAKTIDDLPTRQFILQNLRKTSSGYDWQLNLASINANYDALRAAVADPINVSPYCGEVLFLSGENSDYIVPAHLPVMQALFPRMQQAVIADAGHWLHAENPRQFNHLLNEFFSA